MFIKWSPSLTVVEIMETVKKKLCLWKSEILSETEIRHQNKVRSFASWKMESIIEHIEVRYDFASWKMESCNWKCSRNIILHDERWNNKMELRNVTCNRSTVMEQTSQICTSHVERWRPVKELKECSIEFCKLKNGTP